MGRRLLKYLRYSVLTLIVLLFISFYLTQLDSVKRYVLSYAIESLHEKTGLHLAIDELDLLLPFEVKGRGITISQEKKVIATCDHFLLRLNPTALLDKDFNVSVLTVNGLHLLSPLATKIFPSHERPANISDNNSDWAFTLRRYSIQNLTIDTCISPLLCVKPLNAEGYVHWNPRAPTSDAHFSAHVISDLTISPTEFNLFLKREGEHLIIEASVHEQEEGGILIPDGLSLHAAAELSTTIENWEALVNNTPLKEEIEGPLTLKMALVGKKIVEGKVKGRLTIVDGPSLHLKDFTGKVGKTEMSGALHLSSDLSIDNSTLLIKSDNLSELTHLLPSIELEGAATLATTLKGTLYHPTIEGKLTTPGFYFNHHPLPAAEFYAKASWKEEALEGVVDWVFKEKSREEKILESSHASVRWVYGKCIAFNDINLSLPGIILKGETATQLPSFATTGTLQGDFNDLSLIGKVLHRPIQGTGTIEAIFNSDDAEKQKVSVDFHGANVIFNDFHAKDLSFDAALTNVYDGMKGTIEARVHQGRFEQWEFEDFLGSTRIDMEEGEWPFHFTVAAKDFDAEGEGRWSFDDTHLNIDPSLFKGTVDKKEFSLRKPFSARFLKGEAHVSPLLLSVDTGTFYTSFEYVNNQVYGTVRGTELPLNLFDFGIYENPIEGTVNFDAYFFGAPTLLGGHLNASINQLTIPASALSKLPPLHTSLTANLTKDGLFIKGVATGSEKTPIDIAAELPIKLMLTAPLFIFDQNKPLKADLKAKGPIAPLLELFITDTTTMMGDATVDLKIGGTAAAPTVLGQVSLSDAAFESSTFGAQLHHINATLLCDGTTITLKEFVGKDDNEGKISATGSLLLAPAENFPYSGEALLESCHLINLDEMKSIFSGTLSLKGNSREAFLNGKIVNDKAIFSTPKKSASLSDYVEITYINQAHEELSPTLIKYDPLLSIPLNLDILLEIPNTLSIEDESLKSLWKGEIKIKGNSNAPALHGEIKLTEGEYLLNGKEFDLSQGTILFAGDAAKKTTLHVTAVREINNIRVEIVLKGKVSDPTIVLRSIPSLSQQEILSLILFGKSPSEITPNQDEQLEQSLSNLKVDDYEPGFFERIQKTIGIDRIDINRDSTGQSDEVSIHVGKYITKDVYISVEKGLGDEPNSFGIEAKILENVKMTVEASDDVSGQVSLKWRHDY